MQHKALFLFLLLFINPAIGIQTNFESFSSLADFAMYVLRSGYSPDHSLVALDLDGTLIELDEKGTVRLLDPDTAQIIQLLQDSGCKVIGLTARRPEKAAITFQQLQDVDINFTNDPNFSHSFDYHFFRKGQKQSCKFAKNIIFAGKNEKGRALLGFDSVMRSRCEDWSIRYFFFLDNTRIWVERFKERFEKIDSSEYFALAGHFNPTNRQSTPLFEETRKKAVRAIEALWAWIH